MEERGHFIYGLQRLAEDEINSGPVYRQRRQFTRRQQRRDPVFVRNEGGETLKPAYDPGIVRMQQVGAIAVDARSIGQDFVMGIAGDMGPLVDNLDVMTGLRQFASISGAGKSGADN